MNDLKIYKKALIIVDMVNGFVREGVLHDKSIEVIINRQIEIINNQDNITLIVFIKDEHTKDSTELKRFGDTIHCEKGTHESEVIDEFKIYEEGENVISIPKNSTSFMEAPMFRTIIPKLENIRQFEIMGCCTDICIANGTIGLSNYLNQNNIDASIYVHEDAIATYGAPGRNKEEYEDAAKLLMKQQGIQFIKKYN